MGDIFLHFWAEDDPSKKPDYFRCCRSLSDGLINFLNLDDQAERELVLEIIEAEHRKLLDVWIIKLKTEKESTR